MARHRTPHHRRDHRLPSPSQQLRAALRRRGRPDLAESLLIEAKRGYVYLAEAEGSSICRLKHTGNARN